MVMISQSGPGNSGRPRTWRGRIGGFFALLLVALAKLKALLFFLLHVPALGSLLTFLLSVAVYGASFGWAFGIGFAVLLMVHELGHYVAIRREGLHAGLPVFIPFMGAAIFLRSRPQSPQQEYWIAAAGPLAGTLASLACWGLALLLRQPVLAVIAYSGFFLQAFNLIPVWPLDGGRMVAAVDRRIWWIGVPVLALMVLWLHSLLALIIGALVVWQFLSRKSGSSPELPVPPAFRLWAGAGWLGLLVLDGLCTYLVLH